MRFALVILFFSLAVDGMSLKYDEQEDIRSKSLATILLAFSPTLARTRGSHSPTMSAENKASEGISRRAAVLAPAVSAPAVLWPLSASAAANQYTGTYTDPQHPGCTRTVKVSGSDVKISGFDQPDGEIWKVTGKTSDTGMAVDFTAKGGPTGVPAEWTGTGFKFPDGNVWTKLKPMEMASAVKWTGIFWDPKKPGSEYKIVFKEGQAYLKASDGIGPEFKWNAKGAIIANKLFLNSGEGQEKKGFKGMVTGTLTAKGAEFDNGQVWELQGGGLVR